jgi:Uma2 family endonuclease
VFGHPHCILGHEDLPKSEEAEHTMGMPVASERYWTVEDVWALDGEPGVRYEAVDGELLVTPAPNFLHQRAILELANRLNVLVRGIGIGEAVIAPSDVVIPLTNLVQPDVYVIRKLAKAEFRLGPRDMPLPILATEVLSPSSARHDRGRKRHLYQRTGIEYWVIDLDARFIERWMPDSEAPEVFSDFLEWSPPGAPDALQFEVGAFMAAVHEDL